MDAQHRSTANHSHGGNTRLFVILFAAALLFGLLTGRFLLRGPQPASSGKWLAKNPVALSSSQTTILVAGVDDLNQLTVILEQAWLVTLDLESNSVHLDSLYPGINTAQPGAMLKPHSPLMVQTTDFASLTALDALTSQVYEWDYSMYVDSYALSTLIELASGTEPDLLPEDISSLVATRPVTWQDPANATLLQSSLVQFLCAHQQSFSQRQVIGAVRDMLGEHILTDMPKRQANKILDAFSEQAGQYVCQFPVYETPTPTPEPEKKKNK